MSIQSASLGGGSGSTFDAIRDRMKPKDMTKDQLTQLDQKLKSQGKDTSNLDKMIANFDQLDTNQDGKVSMDELKQGAQQFGIQLPKGGHHHHHKSGGTDSAQQSPNAWGPPPGLVDSDGDNDGSTATGNGKSLLDQMIASFGSSDPGSQDTSTSNTVSIAA